MEISDLQPASDKLLQLRSEYQVDIVPDWGEGSDGVWQKGKWAKAELDKLHNFIGLLAGAMGGSATFIKNLGGVQVKKADIGSHGGEALSHLICFSETKEISPWTTVHEFAHAWDANHGWRLSLALEKYTGGRTNYLLGFLKRLLGESDAGMFKIENTPGQHGRLSGCNAAGYFYNDKPSGSDWNFNRKEDFAESVAMYIGWRKNNELSAWAEARIQLHLLENDVADPRFGVDKWADYKNYFYPEDGNYAKTRRWQFVDDLLGGRIRLS
jgi:hypothetical protein